MEYNEKDLNLGAELAKHRKNEMHLMLDALQETGYTNMFNAPRVLRDHFGITKTRSYEIFQEWTENFKAQDNS